MTSPSAGAYVEVKWDTRGAEVDLERKLRGIINRVSTRAGKQFDPLGINARRVGAIVTRSMSGAAKAVAGFLAVTAKVVAVAVAMGIVQAAAGALTSQLLALAGAIAPVGGLIAVLPGIVFAAAAAFGAVKLAVSGVADAFTAMSETDPKKFNAALAKLAPSARAFVVAARDLRPLFESLQKYVQGRFFTGFDTELRQLARASVPTLRTGLGALVTTMNKAARSVADFAERSSTQFRLAGLLDVANTAAGKLGTALVPVADAILSVASAGGAGVTRIAAGFADAANRLAAYVGSAAGAGRVTEIIDRAIDTAVQLGHVLGNVGSILSSVWSAANAGAGGALGNLQKLTGTFAEFLDSAKGQNTLTSLFASIRTTGEAVLPLFTSLAGIIGGQVAPILAGLAQAASAGLSDLIDGLGLGIAALAPVVEPVGKAFGAVAAAIGPLVAEGGKLIAAVLGPLSAAVTALLPSLSALAQGLLTGIGGIVPLIGPVAASFAQIASALAPVLTLGGQLLAAVIGPLTVAIAAIAGPLGEFAHAVGSQLAGAMGTLLPPLLTAAQTLLGALMPAITALLGPVLTLAGVFTGDLLPVIAGLAVTVLGALLPAIDAIAPVLGTLLTALAPVVGQLAAEFGPVLAEVAGAAARLITGLTPLLPVLAGLLPPLIPLVASVAELAASMVTGLLPVALSLVGPLTGLLGLFSQYPALLYTAIGVFAAWQAAMKAGLIITGVFAAADKVRLFWGNAVAVATKVWAGVQWLLNAAMTANPIGLIVVGIALLVGAIILAWKHSDKFRAVVLAVWDAVKKAFGAAISWLGDFFGGIGGWLADAGTAIADFFTRDIPRWFGQLVDFFASLPGQILDFLASIPGMLWDAFTAAFGLALEAVGLGIGLLLAGFIALPGLLASAWSAITDAAVGAVTAVVDFLTSLPGRAYDAMLLLGGYVLDGILAIAGFFTALPGRIWDALKNLGVLIGTALISAFTWWNGLVAGWITAVVAFFTGLPDRIAAGFARFREVVADAFAGAKQTAGEVIAAIIGFVTGLPDRIRAVGVNLLQAGKDLIGKFGEGLNSMKDFAGNLGDKIVAKIKAGLNWVIDKINGGIAKVDDKLPGVDLPRIPRLARGAHLTRPTLALVAEAGPEVVIPLTRPRRARELAETSGLLDLLAATGTDGGGREHGGDTHHWHIAPPTPDPAAFAMSVSNRIGRKARR